MTNPVALITGSSRRIGAETAKQLHANNFNVVLHYRHTQKEAQLLAEELNSIRSNSAVSFRADLKDVEQVRSLAVNATSHWGRIDTLVNNASSYSPTPFGEVTEEKWSDVHDSDTKAAFFLS